MQYTTLSDGALRGRNNNFNLIRMIAATAVLVSHAWPLSLGPRAVAPLERTLGMSLGALAVAIFFGLSGYFITASFQNSRGDRMVFIQARLLRLFPALAVVAILTVVVAGVTLTTAPAAQYWPEAVKYVLRTLSLALPMQPLPGVFENNPFGPPVNGSLWTLFYEFLCYMGVFALGIVGLLRRDVLLLLIAGLVLIHTLHLPEWYHPRLMRLAELGYPFSIGMAFRLWQKKIPLHWLICVATILLSVLARPTPWFSVVFIPTVIYCTFYLGHLNLGRLRDYNLLGDYSYGTYIYAFPIQQLVAHWGVRDPLTNILIALPITLVCAVLSWRYIEKPALDLRRSSPPPKPQPAPGQASGQTAVTPSGPGGTRQETGILK
ncbi:acyltransferase family protein [Haematobacter massiliensis]|uniref:acyltransferase family protein n=1 Tax=Haematobacter massiliensis TaxID=195105 RepID=UPI0023F188D1|nr:acyltransferase [Haematobacter massiliensis]